VHGDSVDALPALLRDRAAARAAGRGGVGAAVVWLDGHFSGSRFETARAQLDTPVLRELDAALRYAGPHDTVRLGRPAGPPASALR
jgi:hypothetical protein